MDFLQRITLRFPMTLSWDRPRSVSQISCHKRLGSVFTDVFERIQSAGLEEQITSFGGWAFRFARNAPARSYQLIRGESQLI